MKSFFTIFICLIVISNTISENQEGNIHSSTQLINRKILKEEDLMYYSEVTQIDIDEQSNEQHNTHEQQESHYLQPDNPDFWWTVLLATVLTITGAFCSGMGVGFCNIDTLQLQVMKMSKNQEDKKQAQTILEVVSDHHLFLTTLLVYNAIALESLPLVIHKLMPAWAAILFSTFIVLIAAQIVPQAVCTGPKKMIIAYYASPIVINMRKALFFIIIPIARGLDKLMGTHSHHRIQHKDFATYLTGNKVLKKTEKRLLTATLQLRCSRVHEIMIPLKKLFMLELNETLNQDKIKEILKLDYSFILVYETKRENIIGFIKVKEFSLKYLKSQNKTPKVSDFVVRGDGILSVYQDTNLLEMLMLFESHSVRIALVCDQKKKINTGIPSIMYTKNDMIIKKKEIKIIGVIFLYQIFDKITDFELKAKNPKEKSMKKINSKQQIELQNIENIKQPLMKKQHS